MKKIISNLLPLAYGQYFNLLSFFAPKTTGNKAFLLLSTVRKGKVLPHQKEYLENAKYEMLQIGEHDIQTYQWIGHKETVLLLHGWESNSHRWGNLIEKLRQNDYNIIAFDAPGHGYSSGKTLYAPLYAQILQFIIEKYHPKILIGHSFGGMAILYNEYKNPVAEFGKIITIGSPSEFREILDQYQYLLKFNNRVLTVLGDYIYTRFGFYPIEFSTSNFVKSNTKKGLLLHDKKDKITPYHCSVHVHAHWKDSQLISTEGLGHSMHQDEVNEQILDFLKS